MKITIYRRLMGNRVMMPLWLVLLISVVLLAFQNNDRETPEQKLSALGISLPKIQGPANAYLPLTVSDKLVFLSGKGPKNGSGYITGKLGGEISEQEGYAAARLVAIAQLAELKAKIGKLSRVKRILKVSGFVNSTPDFTGQSKVLDGFSDLMVKVFGEKGKHSRTAVGVTSLPYGMALEVEVILEIE